MDNEAISKAYLPIRDDWLGRGAEEAIEPNLPIVDCHHHLWDRPGSTYLQADLESDIKDGGHNVVATVYVQSANVMYRRRGEELLSPLGEIEFANGVGAVAESKDRGSTAVCAGIVGFADLTAGTAIQGVLDAYCAAAPDRFRGVRFVSLWDKDERLRFAHRPIPAHFLSDSKFRTGFAELGKRGLSFDALVFHTQLGDVTELARAFPQTRIALNHFGVPLGMAGYRNRSDDVFANWRVAVRELARCDNVTIKLGGLGMSFGGFDFHTLASPPSSTTLAATWRRYFDVSVDAFGVGRCMFESNFPVDKSSYSYGTVWNAFKRLAAGASDVERKALFSGTASGFYRLSLDADDN